MKISRLKLHQGMQCGPKGALTFLTSVNYDIEIIEKSNIALISVKCKETGEVSYTSVINAVWFTQESSQKSSQPKSVDKGVVKKSNDAKKQSTKNTQRASKKKPSSNTKL